MTTAHNHHFMPKTRVTRMSTRRLSAGSLSWSPVKISIVTIILFRVVCVQRLERSCKDTGGWSLIFLNVPKKVWGYSESNFKEAPIAS